MTPTVRLAESRDLDVIIEFNRLLALESEGKALDPSLLRPGVAAGLAHPAKCKYFVAEDNGKVLGQMAITYEWSDWRNGWFWWVQSVYVRPESRQRGVFRTLFEHVQGAARKDPEVIGIRLYVEHENRGAQEVYRRLGMEATGYQVLEKYPL